MTAPDPAHEALPTEALDASSSSPGEWVPQQDDVLARYIEDAYEKVPSIGNGHRWYDLPYKLLGWLSSSWARRCCRVSYANGCTSV
jgi:hypothetical protein